MNDTWLYLLASDGLHKIGISRDPSRRRKEIQNTSGRKVDLIETITIKHGAKAKELHLHIKYAGCREYGEWFRLTPEQVQEVRETMFEWADKSEDDES